MDEKFVKMRTKILGLRRKVVDAKGDSVEGLTPLPEQKEANMAPRKKTKSKENAE